MTNSEMLKALYQEVDPENYKLFTTMMDGERNGLYSNARTNRLLARYLQEKIGEEATVKGLVEKGIGSEQDAKDYLLACHQLKAED